MISPRLAEKAREVRHYVEGLSCDDVELLREAGMGRAQSSNPVLRKVWKPGPAWKARVELWQLARAIDEILQCCSGE